MAKVNLKIRASKIAGKDGTIYYQISHRGQCKLITTGIHVSPEIGRLLQQSDQKDEECQDLGHYRQLVHDDFLRLENAIHDLDLLRVPYTVADIVNAYRSPRKTLTFTGYMESIIAKLQEKRKFGTVNNYTCTLRSFQKFLGERTLVLSALNAELISDYSDWLEGHAVVRNSVSFYMRILRAVYNRAVKENLIAQAHPFQEVYTGIDHTRKLAIDESVLYQLIDLDLSDRPALALSRDLFVFSYCMRGMAFVDIAFLKKTNVCNQVVSYYRRKTRQLLAVRIEPCAAAIMKRYEEKTKNSDYVFPLLQSSEDEQLYHRYHTLLTYHNRKLKKLSQMLGLSVPLSSYTPRHTWATVARNHNIPLTVISAGMGHTSETTTAIYLASLQNTVVDEANHVLLEKINRRISF